MSGFSVFHISVNWVPSTSTERTLNPLGDRVDLGPGLAGLRHADRVAVVLNEEEHGKLVAAGVVQRLEELAFGGRALTRRHVDDLVVAVALTALAMPHACRYCVPVQAVGETTRSFLDEKCSLMFRPPPHGSSALLNMWRKMSLGVIPRPTIKAFSR
jgi:hypothetical protein